MDKIDALIALLSAMLGSAITFIIKRKKEDRLDFDSILKALKQDNDRLRAREKELEAKLEELSSKYVELEKKFYQLQAKLLILESADIVQTCEMISSKDGVVTYKVTKYPPNHQTHF